jgi:hypothetical protein
LKFLNIRDSAYYPTIERKICFKLGRKYFKMVQVPPIAPDLLIASLATIESAISQTAPAAMNQFATSAGMPTMVTPRENAITTLLSNGKVLIAGGG